MPENTGLISQEQLLHDLLYQGTDHPDLDGGIIVNEQTIESFIPKKILEDGFKLWRMEPLDYKPMFNITKRFGGDWTASLCPMGGRPLFSLMYYDSSDILIETENLPLEEAFFLHGEIRAKVVAKKRCIERWLDDHAIHKSHDSTCDLYEDEEFSAYIFIPYGDEEFFLAIDLITVTSFENVRAGLFLNETPVTGMESEEYPSVEAVFERLVKVLPDLALHASLAPNKELPDCR